MYTKENDEGEPDCVFINHGETIEGVFEELMDLDDYVLPAGGLKY